MASPIAGEINSTTGEAITDKEDLPEEILLRLPTKSLLQFRCVSKHWCFVISTPKFRRHFRRCCSVHSPSNNSWTTSYTYPIPIIPTNTLEPSLLPFVGLTILLGFQHVHSCNGLCLGFLSDPSITCGHNLYVYNPCTRYCTSLSLPREVSHSAIKAINLAFDPLRKWYMEVYKKRFKDNFDYFLKRGVFSQGCLHWVCKNNSFLAFDVENERFRDMPSTRVPESGRKIRYFGDLGGRLHVIREYGGTPLVDVMELKIDYSEWSLKYRVDIVGLGRRIGGNAGRIEIDILCLVEATGEGKIMLIVSGQGRIFAYDIIGRTFEEVCNVSNFASVKQDPYGYKYHWCRAFQHFETLACP